MAETSGQRGVRARNRELALPSERDWLRRYGAGCRTGAGEAWEALFAWGVVLPQARRLPWGGGKRAKAGL